MYATCSHGHRHWGTAGAAGGMVVAPGEPGPKVLLTLRSAQVHQGNTWSLPGGAIDPEDSDAHAAARREICEELGLEVSGMPVVGHHEFECGGWTYTTVLLAAPAVIHLTAEGWETDDVRWFAIAEVDALAGAGLLHPGFAASWPRLRRLAAERGAVGLPRARSEARLLNEWNNENL